MEAFTDEQIKSFWKGNEWHKINKGAYDTILNSIKERFEDIISESESITNKSFKILSAIGAFMALTVFKFEPRYDGDLWIFIAAIISLIVSAAYFGFLLFPKYINHRGVSIEAIVPELITDAENTGYQEQMVYYHAATTIANNTNNIRVSNAKRAKKYKYGLIAFSVGMLLTLVYILLPALC